MLVIPGWSGKDTCDGITRRDLLRVGGSAMFGFSLANLLGLQKATAGEGYAGGPGFGKAKSVILIYLQGGPSHLDLWDPKDNVPDKVRSVFKAIDTKVPGVKVTEVLPKISQVLDKTTLIRSMSYTPIGLFNHTAAIYQMLTGYTADKVSPSGQLEPPTPKDFPNVGCNITRLKPVTVPMLPFVMMPRPLQESGVVGKAGTAGFLGRAYDPYLEAIYPEIGLAVWESTSISGVSGALLTALENVTERFIITTDRTFARRRSAPPQGDAQRRGVAGDQLSLRRPLPAAPGLEGSL
jgi:hypothetical protein